jgi:hypothetical protein
VVCPSVYAAGVDISPCGATSADERRRQIVVCPPVYAAGLAISPCGAGLEVSSLSSTACSNIESGATLDLCDQDLRVDDGIFERFSVHEFQECVDRRHQSFKDFIETFPDRNHSCECESTDTDTDAASMKCENGCALYNRQSVV